MSKFNNMGGMLFAHLLFIDQITLFSVVNHQVLIGTKTNRRELDLPIVSIVAAPVITPETTDAGTCYKIKVTIRLYRATLDDFVLQTLRSNDRGCVLLYQDACGYKKVVGSKDHPLFATLTEINGSKPTDFSGFELTLTGKTLHPQLPYITP